MLRVSGDTISARCKFRSDQLLLLHPAAHIRVGQLGPPLPEGLRGPLRRPRASGAVRGVGATERLRRGGGSFPWRPVPMLCPAVAQQCGRATAGFKGGLGECLTPAQGQVDGLLLELVKVHAARATLALLPLPVPVPGLVGGPTMDAEVVQKEHRQVT